MRHRISLVVLIQVFILSVYRPIVYCLKPCSVKTKQPTWLIAHSVVPHSITSFVVFITYHGSFARNRLLDTAASRDNNVRLARTGTVRLRVHVHVFPVQGSADVRPWSRQYRIRQRPISPLSTYGRTRASVTQDRAPPA